MSFGGAVGAMITSIKNNKRSRPSAFRKLKENGVEYTTKTTLQFDQKASPAQLRNIQKKIQREQRAALLKKAFLIGAAILVIVLVIGFVKF
jgi:hypothetical protein